jgi:phage shock protein A
MFASELEGAIFGASIGANIGARKAEMDAKRAEMERLGITQEMLDMAQDIGVSLEKSIEGIKAVRSSLETQQRLAQLLDAESSSLYKKAKQALDDSDEELAKKLLLQRVTVQEKLKKVLLNCVEEKGRLQIMEDNISRLERRAIEIDSLLRRTVSAKSLIGSAEFDVGLSLSSEDPLLQKFKDLGID